MKLPRVTTSQKRSGQDDAQFITWIVDSFLPKHFPEAFCVDRSLLLVMHEHGLRYARHFGFEERPDQTQFLALMNDVGPDFWNFPGFRDALERRDLSPDERIDLIYANVSGDQFEAALMGQNSDYWFPHLVENHALGMT